MSNTLRLFVSIAFLCLSKSLHVFVFLSLPLSKHMWCSPSRPGFTSLIMGISRPVTFSQGSSYWSPINILKLIFSETIRQIELNLYMKTPYDKLAIIYTNCSGHMTKMANMPIYCKNALTKSSQESEGP